MLKLLNTLKFAYAIRKCLRHFKGTFECNSPLLAIFVRDTTQYVFVNSRESIMLTHILAHVLVGYCTFPVKEDA
jgi:hypothetical protein